MALRVLADGTVVAVISDGVSVSDRPDEASRTAVRTGADLLARLTADGVDPVSATSRAGDAAAAAVTDLAGPEGDRDVEHAPACTYVSAVITPEVSSSPRQLSKTAVVEPFADFSALDLVGVVVQADRRGAREVVEASR